MSTTINNIVNIAGYKFVSLNNLAERIVAVREIATAHAIKGTVILAPEGINIFVAGSREAIDALLAYLRAMPELSDLVVKESVSAQQSFRRLFIKLKHEIIKLNRPDINPALTPAPRLSATTLRQWLNEGREVVLLDTRNQFEIDHGTFSHATSIGLDHFPRFTARLNDWAATDPALKNKTIVTFCTGGVRCEKAAPLMLQNGFTQVYQLDGGILKYFEECGGAHYEGNCFVFDERIALDATLNTVLHPSTRLQAEQSTELVLDCAK